MYVIKISIAETMASSSGMPTQSATVPRLARATVGNSSAIRRPLPRKTRVIDRCAHVFV